MWKAILIDNAAVTKHLKSRIDWSALDVTVVGETDNGLTAAAMIEQTRPDLVITEIPLPGMSGLELLERCNSGGQGVRFIFVSEHKEFEYVKQALSFGAVDYLLKPVSKEELEKAVRKALGRMVDSSAAAMFRQASVSLQDFFGQLTENHNSTETALYQNFSSLLGGKDSPVFMGLCFGLSRETERKLERLPYEQQLLQTFMAFNAARDDLERSGYGCFLRKDGRCCCMLGIFSPGEDFNEILQRTIEKTEAKTGSQLRVGIGRLCTQAEDLMNTYEDALRAFDLYYFEQNEILHWDGTPHRPKSTNEEFDAAVKQVFHGIVAKTDTLEQDVDRVLDIIADLHYNNRNAAYGRVMVFTGNLCQELYSNRLLTGSFTQRQDALQHVLEDCRTYSEMRTRLQGYYRDTLPDVYHTASKKNTAEIFRVQEYIREHYREELSLKTMAEMVCVSPHYFSAYFKAETGQNYKAYLTQVRMEQALHLVLNTDLKTYEIAEQVGYNNVRRFADAFRTMYQMSPADYRKLHKNK